MFQQVAPNSGTTIPAAPADDLFCKDRLELQFMSGFQLSPSGLGPHTPTFDFLTEQIRLGSILTPTLADGTFLRGDVEGLVELTTAPVVDGFGSIVFGPSVMIRYNFVQPDARIIPYIQAAAGMVYTDAYQDQNQRAIGQAIEFLLEAGGGVHYRLGENWTLDVESELAHISNARLAPRNLGVNGVGASIGVTYYFK
jgi:lipid A 3-O-deacylase